MLAVLTLVIALVVGGLALLAQWARKSRGAEVTLVVVVLFSSFLMAGLGAIVGFGLMPAAGGEAPDRMVFTAVGVASILVGIVGIGLCVPPIFKILGRPLGSTRLADPPVFFALWLFVMVLANNAASFLILTREPDLGSLFPGGRLSPVDIAATQVPFLIVAFLGVGLGVRRNLRETFVRLGYGPISLKQLGVVVAFVAVAIGLSALADRLFATLQPDLYQTVGELSERVFDPSGLSPGPAVLFALLIGVGAGLGEETLFRGAMQPVLGILPTSILFASMHVYYGLSVLLIYLFLLAIGLGILRRRINTTASFLAHAGYNSLGVIMVYFLGGGG